MPALIVAAKGSDWNPGGSIMTFYFAAELVDTMLRSGATVLRDGRLHAAAEHTPVAGGSLSVPFPRAWPAAARARAQAAEPQ